MQIVDLRGVVTHRVRTLVLAAGGGANSQLGVHEAGRGCVPCVSWLVQHTLNKG